MSYEEMEPDKLHQHLMRLRGNVELPPRASIIIPVNAQGDLQTVLRPLSDIVRYSGQYAIEVILVINNYPSDSPPTEIDRFRDLGIRVIASPSARRPGEVIIVSARALGVQAAKSDVTIHFDADCRIPDINTLLDWYIESLDSGVQLAYSHVGYYDLRNLASVYTKIAIHHTVRWLKRNLLRIPTTRGGNYAIDRALFLQLYRAGKLSVDLQVGPAAKLAGAQIVYSGRPGLKVFTSGRRFRGGWIKIFRYLRYRLRYNIKATPSRKRNVTRTSWEGFDQESERRKVLTLPGEGEASK